MQSTKMRQEWRAGFSRNSPLGGRLKQSPNYSMPKVYTLAQRASVDYSQVDTCGPPFMPGTPLICNATHRLMIKSVPARRGSIRKAGLGPRRYLHRSRDQRLDPNAAGVPEAARGCQIGRVRHYRFRPIITRPGGRGGATQASIIFRCVPSVKAKSASFTLVSRAR